MTIPSRISFVLRTLLGAVALYTVPWLIGVASAATGDTAAPPPDALVAYVQNYGVIVFGLTVAYVGVRWLLKKNASTHWIAQGRTLAAITTAAGIAGTALQAYTSGTPWSGVLATAVLGLLHLADAQGPAPKTAQGGFGRIELMLLLAAAGLVACAASTRETTIRAALVGVDSARDGFLAYDRAHELALTAHCDPAVETREQCVAKVTDSNAKLTAYQVSRAKVDPLFGAAYRAIAAAELLNDDPSITGMQAAVAQLFAAVKPFITTAAPTTGSH